MTTAGIIIIGNEILSGRVQDVNVQHIAGKLNQVGVFLRDVRIIPDEEDVIVSTVQYFHETYDYVFTTGGIGPTHDDITSTSIAKAFEKPVEYNKEIVELMTARYGAEHMTPGRMNMARIPVGASLIRNPVTAVPGFQIENVFVMAGIPSIMQGMFDYVLDKIVPDHPILSATVHCHLAESDIAVGLAEIQEQVESVDIGSYPFWKHGRFGASIVVRGQDENAIKNTVVKVVSLVESLGGDPDVEMI